VRTARGRATDKDALAVIYSAHQRYGARVFTVDLAGRNYPALLQAQNRGWVWFADQRHAAVTRDGRRALAPFGVEEAS
jgi:hypothetical protein